MNHPDKLTPKTDAPIPGGKNVLVEFEEGIAWVIMNRPKKRNAMSPALNKEMLEVLDALEVDDRCGVLVLTGAGEAWSAGMDLKEYFRETENATQVEKMRVRRDASMWQYRRLMYQSRHRYLIYSTNLKKNLNLPIYSYFFY